MGKRPQTGARKILGKIATKFLFQGLMKILNFASWFWADLGASFLKPFPQIGLPFSVGFWADRLGSQFGPQNGRVRWGKGLKPGHGRFWAKSQQSFVANLTKIIYIAS